MKSAEADHIGRYARTRIRYSSRTEHALSRMYGTSVANIRSIRRTAQPDHPARIAKELRQFDVRVYPRIPAKSIRRGTVTKVVGPARPVPPIGHEHEVPRHDLDHLRTEGGVELPVPLR
jgi:hypothetical protein